MILFNKVKKYVDESFKHDEAQLLHFDRTVYWLKKFKPNADEAFLIAAYGHDIERATSMGKAGLGRTKKGFLDRDRLTYHQERGAEVLEDFLKQNSANLETIKKVKYLVSKHEVGGDDDQNLLKDVDSMSFVENNAQIFLSRVDKLGYDKISEKFDWMFNRITSPQIKQLARPFYEKMILELKKVAK